MRYFKYFLLLISFLSFGINVKAQHVGTINDFEVLSEYLNGAGNIKISNTTETTIKFKVSFVRVLASSGTVGSYKPFNMSIQLSTNAGNKIVLLGAAHKITGANFAANQAMLLDKEFSITIENSKLTRGGRIILAYTTDDNSFPINSYNSKEYQFELPTTIPPDIVKAELLAIYVKKWELAGHSLLRIMPNPQDGEEGLITRDIAFYAYSSYSTGGLTGVGEYVRREKNSKDYIYSTSGVDLSVWKSTGNYFYAYTSQINNSVPVYCIARKSNGVRFYTTNVSLINDPDFNNLGILCYAYPTPGNTTPPRGEDPGTRPPRDGEGGTTPPREGVGGVRPGNGG